MHTGPGDQYHMEALTLSGCVWFTGQLLCELPLGVSLGLPTLQAHTQKLIINFTQMRRLLPLLSMGYHFIKYCKWIIYAKDTENIAIYPVSFIMSTIFSASRILQHCTYAGNDRLVA